MPSTEAMMSRHQVKRADRLKRRDGDDGGGSQHDATLCGISRHPLPLSPGIARVAGSRQNPSRRYRQVARSLPPYRYPGRFRCHPFLAATLAVVGAVVGTAVIALRCCGHCRRPAATSPLLPHYCCCPLFAGLAVMAVRGVTGFGGGAQTRAHEVAPAIRRCGSMTTSRSCRGASRSRSSCPAGCGGLDLVIALAAQLLDDPAGIVAA